MRYALLVAYDGTNYGGWQIQNNTVTIQEKITQALTDLFKQDIKVVASGRTDSGVHAAGQVCHFDAQKEIDPKKIAPALNFRLPPDISILKSVLAPQNFDAVTSAKKKTYCYRLYTSNSRNPLKDRYAVHLKLPINIEKLKECTQYFLGEHDFKAYCAARSTAKTTIRTVIAIDVVTTQKSNATDIEIYVTGNGFLYNMVRTIVGTMLYYSADIITKEHILRSLTEKNRDLVGKTMPPQGLTLESVDYDNLVVF